MGEQPVGLGGFVSANRGCTVTLNDTPHHNAPPFAPSEAEAAADFFRLLMRLERAVEQRRAQRGEIRTGAASADKG